MRQIKRTKKITYILFVLSFIFVACGRKHEEAAERLSQINKEVEHLYNEEMNDLNKELSTEDFDEVEVRIEIEDKKELNKENAATLEKIENLYQNAVVMYELEEDIQKLFKKEVLEEQITMDELEDLSTHLSKIDKDKWPRYVTRQEEKLHEAHTQLLKIQEAEKLVDKLSFGEGKVSTEATREGEKEAQEIVTQIENEQIRERYEKRLEEVDEVLTQLEVEYQKATEGVGYFEGMYLSSDDIVLYIDNKKTIFTENNISDNTAYYELRKILNNTGQELTMELYEYPSEMHGTEERFIKDTYYLSDDHQTVTLSDNRKYHRLSQSEQNEILYELPGFKNMIETSHRWNY